MHKGGFHKERYVEEGRRGVANVLLQAALASCVLYARA